MDAIHNGLPVYMLIGIVVVIGIAQINRVLGSVLGVLFWIAVAFIGNDAYAKGHQVGLPGIPLSRGAFFGMCALLAGMQVVSLFHSLQQKRRQKLRREIDELVD